MIAIIDYGMGNLRSVQKAFERVGAAALVTQNPDDIAQADQVVLPGVGAMQPAMERLDELGLIPVVRESISVGKPFLGICLGLQLLFETSSEGGQVQGLGILPGTVERFHALKVPHMGWNQISFRDHSPLLAGLKDGSYLYFCHSYFVRPKDESVICATTDYGIGFVCAIHWNNIFGVQFHPEKSQDLGLGILKNFTEVRA